MEAQNEKQQLPFESHLLGVPIPGRSGSNFQLVLDPVSGGKNFRRLTYAHCKILGFQIVPTSEAGRFHKLPY
nr:MAG TPA: hypothetical protein [Caudoviricetes sp.]